MTLLRWMVLAAMTITAASARQAAPLPPDPAPAGDAQKPATPTGILRIHHFPVGNGDATLVVSPVGRALLIDGGSRRAAGEVVIPALRRLATTPLRAAIVTHFDPDHVGGMIEILRAVERAGDFELYDRGDRFPASTEIKSALPEYFRSKDSLGIERKTMEVGAFPVDLGGGVKITCVAVNGAISNPPRPADPKAVVKPEGRLVGSSENTLSIALVIQFGEFKYFIAGDLGGRVPDVSGRSIDIETIVANQVGVVDVLRLNHHGTTASNHPAFLASLNPRVVVVSAGTGGRNQLAYWIPRRQVLERLLKLPRMEAVYFTSRGETFGGFPDDDRHRLKLVTGGEVSIAVSGATFKVGDATHEIGRGTPR